MTLPALPPEGSADWYGHYTGLHNAATEVDSGRLSVGTLGAAFEPLITINAARYADLPAAFAAVDATGGSCLLRIPPGTYTSAPVRIDVPNVVVEADGVVWTLAGGSNASALTIGPDATGFVMRGGVIDGNSANQAGTSHGVEYEAWTGGLRPADRGGLFGVVVQNVLTDGVRINAGRVQVQCGQGTSIRTFGRYGAYMGGTDCAFQDGAVGIGPICFYLDGHANWVRNSGIYSGSDAAVWLTGDARYSQVVGNSIDNNPGEGLVIKGAASNTMDTIVSGNTFRANGQAADGTVPDIYIEDARAVLLTGNVTAVQADRLRTSWAVQFGAGVSDIFDGGNAWEPLAHVTGLVSDPAKLTVPQRQMNVRNSSGSDPLLESLVASETIARFRLLASGALAWGSGSGGTDVNLYRQTADILRTDDYFHALRILVHGTGGQGFLQFDEQSVDPGAPSANGVRLFAKDNGSGKTQIVARFNTGATVVIATQP